MGLIKSTNAPSQARPFSMADIEAHAKEMLLKAREQADKLLAAAQVEAERLKKEAHAQAKVTGHKEGLAAGKSEGHTAGKAAALDAHKKQLTELTTTVTTMIKELDASRKELISAAQAEALHLAIAIARRATRLAGESDPCVLVNNAVEAVRLAVSKADIKIAVHPSQQSVMEDLLPKLKLAWPQMQHVEVMSDVSLSPGGCRVRTASGTIDADLDVQINRIAAELLPGLVTTPPAELP